MFTLLNDYNIWLARFYELKDGIWYKRNSPPGLETLIHPMNMIMEFLKTKVE